MAITSDSPETNYCLYYWCQTSQKQFLCVPLYLTVRVWWYGIKIWSFIANNRVSWYVVACVMPLELNGILNAVPFSYHGLLQVKSNFIGPYHGGHCSDTVGAGRSIASWALTRQSPKHWSPHIFIVFIDNLKGNIIWSNSEIFLVSV